MKKSQHHFIMFLSLTLLFCFTFSCQEQAEEGITSEEASSSIQSSLAVFNEGNLTVVDELYDSNYVRHDSALPEDIVGLEAFKIYVTNLRTAYPDFKVTADEYFVKGDKIVLRWTVTATNTGPLQSPMGELPPTNKKMSVPGVDIVKVVNGKITEDWVYYNQLSAFLQLGYTLTLPQSEEPQEKK